jgi:hypothetical protein
MESRWPHIFVGGELYDRLATSVTRVLSTTAAANGATESDLIAEDAHGNNAPDACKIACSAIC